MYEFDKYLDKLIEEDYLERYRPENPRLEYLEDIYSSCLDLIENAEMLERDCDEPSDYNISGSIQNVLHDLYLLKKAIDDEISLAKLEEIEWD